MSSRTNQFAYAAGCVFKLLETTDCIPNIISQNEKNKTLKDWRIQYAQKCVAICCAIEDEEEKDKKSKKETIQEACAFTSLALGILCECSSAEILVSIDQVKGLFDKYVCLWKFEANNQKLLKYQIDDAKPIRFSWNSRSLFPFQTTSPKPWKNVKTLIEQDMRDCLVTSKDDSKDPNHKKSPPDELAALLKTCHLESRDASCIGKLLRKFLDFYPTLANGSDVLENLQCARLPLSENMCADLRALVQDIEKENCAATSKLTALINMWAEIDNKHHSRFTWPTDPILFKSHVYYVFYKDISGAHLVHEPLLKHVQVFMAAQHDNIEQNIAWASVMYKNSEHFQPEKLEPVDLIFLHILGVPAKHIKVQPHMLADPKLVRACAYLVDKYCRTFLNRDRHFSDLLCGDDSDGFDNVSCIDLKTCLGLAEAAHEKTNMKIEKKMKIDN